MISLVLMLLSLGGAIFAPFPLSIPFGLLFLGIILTELLDCLSNFKN